MSFTYDQLKQAIQDYTENSETTFVSNLPVFIRAAEERILKNIQLDLFRRNQVVEFKDVSLVQLYNPNVTATGAPQYYAQFDVTNFILAPTPDSNYVVELHYLYRPTSITVGAGSGTTWISTNGELCLFYGALVEAYIFMKGEPDIMGLYDKRFQESIMGLKMLGEAKETTQEYRVGKVIRAKQ
jgi:hypothetical protein